MSPMKTALLFLAATALLYGCGRGTDAGKVFVPGKGHPDAWASHLAVGTMNFHGTFIKSVPSVSAGPKLFVLHCAPCHGNDGSGKIGPNIQADTLPLIVSAIQNRPVMRGHAILSGSELQSIADYITTLASSSNPLVGSFNPVLCSQCHGTNLDGGIALISCYSCHNGPDGGLGHPAGWSSAKDLPVVFHGPYGRDFPSGCTTCHGVDLNGGFVYLSINGSKSAPGCSSCHNGVIAAALAPKMK
jgi:hypothetical protein